MNRPKHNEYPSYYSQYINLVQDGDIIHILYEQMRSMTQFVNSFSEEVAAYRYAPDKWSVKEVVGHVMDTERVFSYRALCFARNDKTHLPAFDQDAYVKQANFGKRTLLDIADEYRSVRKGTICLYRSFEEGILNRVGTASDYSLALRSIPYILVGHEMHHRNVIETCYLKRIS